MTYDDLMYSIDVAERHVHGLTEELREYDEDSTAWQLVYEELADVEAELDFYFELRNNGDYTDS